MTNVDMQLLLADVLNQNLGSLLTYSLSGDTTAAQKVMMQAIIDGASAEDAATVTNTVQISYVKDEDGSWEPEDGSSLFNQLVLGDQDFSIS